MHPARQNAEMRLETLRRTALVGIGVGALWAGSATAQPTATYPNGGQQAPPTMPSTAPQQPAQQQQPGGGYYYGQAGSAGGYSSGYGAQPAASAYPTTGYPGAYGQGVGQPPSSGFGPRDTGGDDSTGGGPNGVVWFGWLALGIPYATGLGIAVADDFANSSGWLALPVAGPWVALSNRDDPCRGVEDETEFNSEVSACVAEPLVRAMLVLSGVLQASGTLALLFAPGGDDDAAPEQSAGVVAGPSVVGRDGYGLAAFGRF